MSDLRITVRVANNVTILGLSGSLVYDQGTRMLREALTTAVAAGARAFLLDLEQITYLDSGGVGTLVAVFRHVTRRGGQLKLLRPSPHARRVLGITHLTGVFDIFDDEAEALLNLGSVATEQGLRREPSLLLSAALAFPGWSERKRSATLMAASPAAFELHPRHGARSQPGSPRDLRGGAGVLRVRGPD